MSQEVIYAVLHQEIFFPTVGQLKKTLTDTHDGVNTAVKMRFEDGVLEVEALDKVGKPRKILVPAANVAFMVLGR